VRIPGKVCLITGAAQGIGAATATALAARGARLALCDLKADAVGDLAERLPGDHLAAGLDVLDDDAVGSFLEKVRSRSGRIGVLVNNAGIGAPRSVDDLDVETWQKTLDVNLTAPFRLVKATLDDLRATRGQIATVASMAARIHPSLLGHYSATKAGVAAFAETLRVELACDGIGVTTVYFGTIDTPLLANGLADPLVTDRMRKRVETARRLGVSPLVRVESAGEAIAAAIEHRRRHVILPRRARLAFYAQAPFQRLVARTTR